MFSSSFFDYMVERETQYFIQYLTLVKSHVDEEEKKLETFQKKIEAEKEKEHYLDAVDHLHDLAYESWEFEELMYKSFVVSVFIFLEDLTVQLCRYKQRETNQSFSYKDIKGGGVGRSITYLQKLLGEHPIADLATREQFDVARKIRNALVHADGILSKEDVPSVLVYIKKNPEILGVHEQTRRVSITYAYAESLLGLATKVTTELRKHWKEDQW